MCIRDSGGLIPDRNTFHKSMWGVDDDIPTDIYYLSRTSWDLDGDGVYGEFTDDRAAITYPDGSVALGRIPVRTPEDVAAYQEKVALYLQSMAPEESARGLALTCAVRGAYRKVARSGETLIPESWPEGKVSLLFNDCLLYTSPSPRDS